MKHPRYQKKGDRLLGPQVRKDEVAIDHAIAPFDRAMRKAEQRWGIDRLPELAPPAVAAGWGKAVDALNTAIVENDLEAATRWASWLVDKGLPRLEAEAVASGAEQMPPVILEHRDDRVHFVVIQSVEDWPVVERLRPGVTIVTLQEVAVALDASRLHVVSQVKALFPAAQMTAIRKPSPLEKELNDEIVF